jgi:hypothetical protein
MNEATRTSPMIVSYGMGVDSTAVLVGLAQRGERPDAILFADTGSEKPETYAYLATINAWLETVGFPQVTVVKNPRLKSGDKSLYEACHRTQVLPALAYGMHQCSIVWKLDPQMWFVRGNRNQGIKPWQPAVDAWARGELVTFCIGYDNGDRDRKRCSQAFGKTQEGFQNRYPLIEWGWDREECERQIAAAGLPVPVKSACFFCPASTKPEIDSLVAKHPNLVAMAIELETRAKEKGLKSVKGLGRRWAWGDYVNNTAA